MEEGQTVLAERMERLAQDKGELQKLDSAALEAERAKHEREGLERTVQQLRELKKGLLALEDLQTVCRKAQEDYQEKARIAQEREEAWQRINRAYLDAQAGVLAANLCPGIPCPVCGSLEHPHPAPISQEAPDEAMWKQAEQSTKLAQQQVAEASRAAGERKKELETREEQLCQQAQALLPALSQAVLPELDELSAEETEQKVKLQTAVQQEKEASDRMKQVRDLAETIPKQEQSLAEETSRLTALDREIASRKAAAEVKRRQAEELRQALPYPTKEEAEEKVAALRREDAALQKGIQDAQTLKNDLEKQWEAACGKLETYQALLQDGEDVDLEQAGQRKEALAGEKETLERESETLQTRLTLNRNAKENLLQHLAELEESSGRLTWLKALSDTANGALTGQERFRLETYIQTTYFTRVLHRANLRLRVMSGGQYDLLRRAERGLRGQVGLDLDVVDHWNGTVRGVETLSGGSRAEVVC